LYRAYDPPIDGFVITLRNLAFRRPSGSGDDRILMLVDCIRPRDNHPGCSGDVRGQGNRHFVQMHPSLQGVDPAAETIAASIKMNHTGPCAMDQQASDIAVAALTDAEQGCLAPDGMLPRDKTQPGHEISGAPELPAIPNSGQESGCC